MTAHSGSRRAFWSVLLGTPAALRAQQALIPADRLKVLAPILLRRQTQLDALRKFPIDDRIAPWPHKS